MKEWDRQRLHDIELTKEVTEKVMDTTTIKYIVSMREEGLSDDRIRYQVSKNSNYSEEDIDKLFHEADNAVINA